MSNGPRLLRPWEHLERRRVYGCRIFAVEERRGRSPRTGELHDFWVLDTADWVNVVPLTADRRVVLVRQYRHGIGGFTLEIPGGLVDPEDASPLEAARRELREETGYDTEDVVPLGVVHPNPAIQNNRCHTFLARDARPTREACFDTTEECEVEVVPLDEVSDLIRSGVISHALVIAAFHHLLLAEGV